MAHKQITIRTDDGECPAHVFTPAGAVPAPAILFFMDGIGIRPALFTMGERMAASGYHVLLPDLFYRAGPYAPMDAKTVFGDPAQRQVLMSRFMPVATPANIMRDTKTFLEHLASDPTVRQPHVGTTGYCMGGRLSLVAAGTYPDRIAAAASFHGGNLANDAPDSPHLLAAKIKARVYVAGATEDANFPEAQKVRLDEALSAAGVRHVVETYPARHGWVPTDTPVHDPACAERHWKALIQLFDETLKV
jgi:carboxymethylenebutenolidase